MGKRTEPDKKRRAAVDWEEIHRRLEKGRTQAEGGHQPAPEETRAILRERARELAREHREEDGPGEVIEVVRFLLGYETYALESSFIREVVPLRDFTPLPSLPSFILGIINVRAQIVSVIDIRKFFDLPEKGLTDLNKAIILRHGRMEFGILADDLLGAETIALDALQPTLPTLIDIRKEYLKGVTPERVVILDAGKLLTDPRMVVHQESGV